MYMGRAGVTAVVGVLFLAAPMMRAGADRADSAARAEAAGRAAKPPVSILPDTSRTPAADQACRTDHDRGRPARAGRPREPLPFDDTDAGRQFRAGRTGRPQDRGEILHPEARQGAVRIRSAEPDRRRRGRLLRAGARPQARHQGHLSAVDRPRCATCSRTASICGARPIWCRSAPDDKYVTVTIEERRWWSAPIA